MNQKSLYNYNLLKNLFGKLKVDVIITLEKNKIPYTKGITEILSILEFYPSNINKEISSDLLSQKILFSHNQYFWDNETNKILNVLIENVKKNKHYEYISYCGESLKEYQIIVSLIVFTVFREVNISLDFPNKDINDLEHEIRKYFRDDQAGIVYLNKEISMLSNLKWLNSIYRLMLISSSISFTSEGYSISLNIYKYGFKLENWQFWDEQVDDLFPSTPDLIEAELDGRADELFQKSLPRIEQMMKEEIEKQRRIFEEKIERLQKNQNSNWEIEQTKKQFERIEKYYRTSLERRKQSSIGKPDWLTPYQIQEIRDLIAENRKLKEEMRRRGSDNQT